MAIARVVLVGGRREVVVPVGTGTLEWSAVPVGGWRDVVVPVGTGTLEWGAVPVGFGGWVGGTGVLWCCWKNPRAKTTASNIPRQAKNSLGDFALLIFVFMLE